ncbi:Hypothetical Protein FCC1311_034892 [Hondaea fermentalgiana]|uniref:Uncharacterized protein n=1 Tax=Hondaea fermentalgiana TaxID=2315210 RepID=A0A2R5G894_9STRA|nr:Hypothetical Protein FCC1311_034892 [Hondaea fermentalgiana]|eukprot:GBG27267.1 Hypothetical Protein FCC1311_034892 [Hondaea fermentalgiana]
MQCRGWFIPTHNCLFRNLFHRTCAGIIFEDAANPSSFGNSVAVWDQNGVAQPNSGSKCEQNYVSLVFRCTPPYFGAQGCIRVIVERWDTSQKLAKPLCEWRRPWPRRKVGGKENLASLSVDQAWDAEPDALEPYIRECIGCRQDVPNKVGDLLAHTGEARVAKRLLKLGEHIPVKLHERCFDGRPTHVHPHENASALRHLREPRAGSQDRRRCRRRRRRCHHAHDRRRSRAHDPDRVEVL